jgi:hypothetical protein
MFRTRWLQVAFALGSLAVAMPSVEQSDLHLRATAAGNEILEEFAMSTLAMDWLDARSVERGPTIVNWEIDLRRNVHHWRNRSIRKATLQVIVVPSSRPGTCEMIRQLDGRWVEPRHVVDCGAAYEMISSFDLPFFILTGVDPGSYEIAIRASITAPGRAKVTTPILARARVVPQ